ncbi:MAG: DNA polymerase I [Salinivirgaceae bacterium]
MAEKKLFLLDAYALAYRAYYAFIKNPRINSKGENTSAVFGFANALLEVLNKQQPSHIGVVFDPHGPTFRNEMYPEYKANREAMPEDLRHSIPFIKELIAAMNIPVLEVKGFEADDVIGTLAKKAEQEGFEVFMMTPDKDYAQLVSDRIFVFKPARSGGDAEIWDREKVIEKFKVTPERIIDLLGLMGDSSDNVPGCPGVGPKGAEKLIGDFGSLLGVYDHIDELKGKQKENLIAFKEQILLSKELVTIETKVPIDFDAATFIVEKPDTEKIKTLFERLEFRTLLPRVIGEQPEEKKAAPGVPVQGSLFDAPAAASVNQPSTASFSSTEVDYRLVVSQKEQDELLNILLQSKEVCFDTETTALEIHSARLVGMAFSNAEGKAWYVSVPKEQSEAQAVVDRFLPFFTNPDILKIGQNLKYDMQVMKNYGVHFAGPFFDTMIAHYLIQPDFRHNLDDMARSYLNYETIKTEELIGKKGKGQRTMDLVPVEQVKDYACEDADITFRLYPKLKKELEQWNLTRLFHEIEVPLIPVLTDMEYAGVRLDRQQLAAYAEKLNSEVAEVEQQIYQLAGETFNIASPKQLGDILFEKLRIVSDAKKTKTKQYATGEEVLVKLTDKHPIVPLILEYRSIKKLVSTYVEALPQLVHPQTEKIHTSYNQTITATGRLSSNNPNLQNIPIREARGREIRKAFIPSDTKHVLFAADYSQIELRLMAHLSNDEHMIEAFARGEDIHAATAARIFGIPQSEVSREQRSFAKGANFGIIYGISAFGLAQNLNISRSEAKNIIDSYFASYPGVKQFMDESIRTVREKGYAETLFGRRRYLADIHSGNAIVRGAAERNAINAPIQGAAADIIKIAMINVQKALDKAQLKSKMILQVHDELVFDVLQTELDEVKVLVVREMEQAVLLKVPLTVDFGVGSNWLEAH